MSLSEMIKYITVSVENFPSIDVVVFTGGECTLLKDSLLDAIKFCTTLNLKTRIVTNGYWAKNKGETIKKLNSFVQAGLSEINVSTGKDHMKYIPISNVMNIMEESCKNDSIDGIIIAIEERDDYEKEHPYLLLEEKRKIINNNQKVLLVKSPWINFRNRRSYFNHEKTMNRSGCKNLFTGIQINPNGQLLSCCGLACEYTPFLKLGKVSNENITELYGLQFYDLLKLWLYTEGPVQILNKINNDNIQDCRHDCDHCLELLTNKDNIQKLINTTHRMANEIILKYSIKTKI
jgi:hypothetical protein